MKQDLLKIKEQAIKEIEQVSQVSALEEVESKYFARKSGQLTKILRGIKDLPEKERPSIGQLANQIKRELEEKIARREKELEKGRVNGKDKFFDPTLPGKDFPIGHLHPLTQLRQQVEEIFRTMNFEVVEGQEIENDYYNFEALNMPEEHPARDMWDTFYINPPAGGRKSKIENRKLLLRTHTSNMQVRMMEKRKPPLRVCVIGKCFRHEATDATHEHTLYQIEGFAVDKEISVANLIDTLKTFLDALFGRQIEVRLRPSYFPFVEPGYELDMECLNCQGKGCKVCQQSGWVEILGCGLIHPKVFQFAGYKKGEWTGYAFGAGLDRIAMMKYKIDDIRWFHKGDLRFIRQF